MDCRDVIKSIGNDVVKVPLRKINGTNKFKFGKDYAFDLEFFADSDKERTRIMADVENSKMLNCLLWRKRPLAVQQEVGAIVQHFRKDPFGVIFSKFARYLFVYDGVDIRCPLTLKKDGLYARRGRVGVFSDGQCRGEDGRPAAGWRFADAKALRAYLKERGDRALAEFLTACEPRTAAQEAWLRENAAKQETEAPRAISSPYRKGDVPVSAGEVARVSFLQRDGRVGFRHVLVMGDTSGDASFFACCLLRKDETGVFLERDEVPLPNGWVVELWNYREFSRYRLCKEDDLPDAVLSSVRELAKCRRLCPPWERMPFFPSVSPIAQFRQFESAYFVRMSMLSY